MRIAKHVLIMSAVLLPGATQAQQHEEASIVLAAIAYLRDEMPRGMLVIDADTFRGTAALADSIAMSTGATRGRISEERTCPESHNRRPLVCSMRRNVTVVAFSTPVIRDNAAEVAVGWWYQEAPGLVARKEASLLLGRHANDCGA